VPQLADEGLYLASESTMYRVQHRYGLRREEVDVNANSRDPRERCPSSDSTRSGLELGYHVATGDFAAPTYLIMDVWSRRIVGWRIAERESAEIGAALVTQACADGNVNPRGFGPALR
jgi:transposase InsO family protein